MSSTLDQMYASFAQADVLAESGTKRDVLILAHEFPPDNIVGALRPFRFAKYLPVYGFRSHVVTASPQGASPVLPRVVYVPDPLRADTGIGGKLLRRIAIIPLRLTGLGPGNLALAWVPAATAAAEAILSDTPVSTIVSTFPPLATHLVALLLKRRHPRLKWVADFRDPLTGNPLCSRGEALWNRMIEPRIFRNADSLIANTDAAAERWRALYPRWKDKITYIWNGFDPEESVGPRPIPLRDQKLLVHVGEIYGGRHPQLLLDSLYRLVQSGQMNPAKFRVHLIGDIDLATFPDKRVIEALVRSSCLLLTPAVPSPEAARVMAEADSLLLIDWTGPTGGLQVPYKLYLYIRIGRPILAITNRNSPVDQILAESGVVYCCLYPDESEDVRDAKVKRFWAQPPETRTASEWFFDKFDGKKQVSQLATILNQWES